MIEVTLPRLPEPGVKSVFGPETDALGRTHAIDADEILASVAAIAGDTGTVALLAADMVENIRAANGLRPRPEIDGRAEQAILSHVPAYRRDAFAYFTRVFELIHWNAVAHHPELRALQDVGLLKLSDP